eukprot:SAG25_NODE_677_length_5979_cov_2.486395_2_plen_54_part_00
MNTSDIIHFICLKSSSSISFTTCTPSFAALQRFVDTGIALSVVFDKKDYIILK